MITKQLNKICKVLVHTKLLPDTFTCKLLYYRKFKKWPNLNNPQDINEKMMCYFSILTLQNGQISLTNIK